MGGRTGGGEVDAAEPRSQPRRVGPRRAPGKIDRSEPSSMYFPHRLKALLAPGHRRSDSSVTAQEAESLFGREPKP